MATDYQGIVAHGLAIQIASKIREALKRLAAKRRSPAHLAALAYAAASVLDSLQPAVNLVVFRFRDRRRQYARAQLARARGGKSRGAVRRA